MLSKRPIWISLELDNDFLVNNFFFQRFHGWSSFLSHWFLSESKPIRSYPLHFSLHSVLSSKTSLFNRKFSFVVGRYLEKLENNPDIDRTETLGSFIKSHGYSQLFQEAYLVRLKECAVNAFVLLLVFVVVSQWVESFRFQFVLQSGHVLQMEY